MTEAERMKLYAPMKLSHRTRRLFNLIAKHTDRTIIEIAEELAEAEWRRVAAQVLEGKAQEGEGK